MDFSFGNFTNWKCRTGLVSGYGGVNKVIWTGEGPIGDRFEMIPPGYNLNDNWTPIKPHYPKTDGYCVKLGNETGYHEAEGLSYTFTVPTTSEFSLLFNYAVVLQNPDHYPHEQPRFRARVVDDSSGKEISCVSFDFSASGLLIGFKPTRDNSGIYKDWTPVSINLSSYKGKVVRLEFITSDCVYTEHFAYAYINVGSVCNKVLAGGARCEDNPLVSVLAPYGYDRYEWYADTSFRTVIETSQLLQLPAAMVQTGAVYPVVVSPVPGYGCLDTLYAVISEAAKPLSVAGADRITCSKVPVQIGTAAIPSYTYSWTPYNHVSDPSVADPFTRTNLTQPTDLVVKTTDKATLCFAYDTVRISPVLVDTASINLGKEVFCPGEHVTTTLALHPSLTANWYKNNYPVPGATASTYQVQSAGNYWAQIHQYGCVDSTRVHPVRIFPRINVDFAADKEVQCLENPIAFKNRSKIPTNEPLTYSWKTGEVLLSREADLTHRFVSAGAFPVKLVATSAGGCRDSLEKTVRIVDICGPLIPSAFTPNHDGKNDTFKPYLAGTGVLKRFTIFNRYGNVVFSAQAEGKGWDGMYKGLPLPAGVFVWQLEYHLNSQKTEVKKGTVTLIR